MNNVIAFPTPIRLRRNPRAQRDFLVLREDGCLGLMPKKPNRSADARPEVVEDFAAERRLAEQALERD